MCAVAVRQSGVPRVIRSQSAKPVRAVGAVTISPTISASAQPCAASSSAIPTLLRTEATVANV